MRRVTVTIDRLTLRGVDPAHRHALVEALKAELERMLADPASGVDRVRSRSVAVVRGGQAPAEPGLGGAVARTIAKEVGR